MLAHCVNPDCRTALRSFSEGRLFQFEIVSICVAAQDEDISPMDEKPRRQTSHFWLCGGCASKMFVTLEPMSGIKVMPLEGVSPVEAELARTVIQPQQSTHC